MARPTVDDDVHKRMKRFATHHDMTVKQSYKFVIKTLVNKDGTPKEDFRPLKEILDNFKKFLG